MENKMKIGLLYGGKSTEHEVSINSCKNIYQSIDKNLYQVILIYLDKSGHFLLNETQDVTIIEKNDGNNITISPGVGLIHQNKLLEVDVLFPVLHGNIGEDGSLQGLFQMLDIPYVGCNARASSICMDKDITKRLLRDSGIDVSPGIVFKYYEKENIDFQTIRNQFGLPLFIKPVNQGSSVGVTKVENESEFKQSISTAFKLDRKIMIESGIVGREIEVSVIGNSIIETSVPGEIVIHSNFYDYNSKYVDDSSELFAPAHLTKQESSNIQSVAKKAYEVLDCEGLARVDVFLTEDGRVVVNEINTLPGFTNISMFPRLFEVEGIHLKELISRLITLANERFAYESKLIRSI